MPSSGPAEQADESRRKEGIEASRQSEIEKFGMSGIEELGYLEYSIRQLEQAAEKDPANAEVAGELELEKKRLELFLYEHDNAGAFKFKRFGREMRGFFEDKPEQPKVFELDREKGQLALAESEKGRRLLFVNMGELDRFNKEGGGHAAGDAVLAETSRTIEAIVRDNLRDKTGKQTGYELLRYSGNEFMVSFSDISKEEVAAISEAIEKARPGEKLPGVSEGAPLSSVEFDLGEAVEIMNQLQLTLGEDERISTPDEANRELIEVMKQRANYALDVTKFRTRVERVRQKQRDADKRADEIQSEIDGLERSGKDGEQVEKLRKELQKTKEEVPAFFTNYMAKMFGDVKLEAIAALNDLPPSDAEKRIGEIAFEATKQRLVIDKGKDRIKEDIIKKRVDEIRGRQKEREAVPAFIGPLPLGTARLADIPKETVGQSMLREKKEAIAKAAESGNEHAAEKARIEHQIEAARRDEGTGLLERGVHYEALEDAFMNGEKKGLVFVDMGFLKYFDQAGGSDVGDNALKLAAELMTRAIKESGVKGEAYRYGGDEFTVQVDGGQAEIAKFQEKLQELRTTVGAVDVGKKGSKDNYFATGLVFNYGVADMEMAEQAFQSLKEAGVYEQSELDDPQRVANIKAEVMTVIADKSIESEKAVNRFLLLIEKKREVGMIGDEVLQQKTAAQVEQLKKFSSKAIFGESGGNEKLEEWAASDAKVEDLRTAVEDWVSKEVQKARTKEQGRKDLREQLVDLHVRVWYYEQEIAKLAKTGAAQEARLASLERERDLAVKDRRALLDVRKKLE